MGGPKRRIKKIGNAVSLKQNKEIVKIPAMINARNVTYEQALGVCVCVCVWRWGGGGWEGDESGVEERGKGRKGLTSNVARGLPGTEKKKMEKRRDYNRCV